MKEYIIIELDAGHDSDRKQKLYDNVLGHIKEFLQNDGGETMDLISEEVDDQLSENIPAGKYEYLLISDVL